MEKDLRQGQQGGVRAVVVGNGQWIDASAGMACLFYLAQSSIRRRGWVELICTMPAHHCAVCECRALGVASALTGRRRGAWGSRAASAEGSCADQASQQPPAAPAALPEAEPASLAHQRSPIAAPPHLGCILPPCNSARDVRVGYEPAGHLHGACIVCCIPTTQYILAKWSIDASWVLAVQTAL
jgi:hypothetical protein